MPHKKSESLATFPTEAVETVLVELDAVRTSGKSLSERALVICALDFISATGAGLHGLQNGVTFQAPHDSEDLEISRSVSRVLLDALIAGEPIDDSQLHWEAQRMLLLPTFKRLANGRLQVFHHYVAQFLAPALAYIFLLLLDPARGYGSDLCKCQLESCGRYFLVKRRKRGLPRRKYCGDAHMLKAHAAQSTSRVRNSRMERAKRKTEAEKSRRRGSK